MTAAAVASSCTDRSSDSLDGTHDELPPRLARCLVDVTAGLGLAATTVTGAAGGRWMPEIMGGGLAVFDADGDDRLDVYVVNGHGGLPDRLVDDVVRNRLFIQSVDGRFIEAHGSGLEDGGYGQGVAVGDIDNDGDLDVYVSNHGPDRLFRNRGDGTFDDVTDAAGVDVPGWSCSAAFLDYDLDGHLDLFVTQYLHYRSSKSCTDRAGRPDYCGPREFPPAPDVLLRNRGDGTFEDVSGSSGIDSRAAAGLGVVCVDLDRDGRTDVYVANDGYANHLWLNDGRGGFREAAVEYGVGYSLQGQAEAGMGVVVEDLDGDGRFDLLCTHLAEETNTYYRQLDDGRFVDATGGSGLAMASMTSTGFGVAVLDLELDGDLDLAIANGRVARSPHAASSGSDPWRPYAERNHLYINDAGSTYRCASGGAADGFGGPVETSRALAAVDLDDDGDVDLVVTSLDAPLRVYRNEAARAGRWLRVRAHDARYRRDAIGAEVQVRCDGRTWTRVVTAAGSYVTSTDPRPHFGLGAVKAEAAEVDVRWPGGGTERFAPVPLDATVTLVRGGGSTLP